MTLKVKAHSREFENEIGYAVRIAETPRIASISTIREEGEMALRDSNTSGNGEKMREIPTQAQPRRY